MSFKDIMVHLDGSDHDAARLALALDIARRFDAKLTGLFARTDSFEPGRIARRESDRLAATAEACERAFRQTVSSAALPTRFWRLSHGEPGHVIAETVACTHFADLVVLGQQQDDGILPAEFIEQVILHAGRPCLVVPASGTYPSVGANVLIGWNGGQAASRALHDAMPFIASAASVEVVTVRNQPAAPKGESVPPLNICEHLSAHGVHVRRETLVGDDIGVMDLLLSRSFDFGADLLVMGAHDGHALPFVKGGGTKHILRHMSLPVLMSH